MVWLGGSFVCPELYVNAVITMGGCTASCTNVYWVYAGGWHLFVCVCACVCARGRHGNTFSYPRLFPCDAVQRPADGCQTESKDFETIS